MVLLKEEIRKLKRINLEGDRFYRKQRDKRNLRKPIRARHFLEDFAIIINLLETDEKIQRFGYWATKSLKDIFELKIEKC